MNRRTAAVVAFLLIVSGSGVGYVIGAYPVIGLAERHIIPANHNQANIPDSVQMADEPVEKFQPFNADDARPVFAQKTHDPMLVEEDGMYYMVVGTTRGEGQQLYRTETPADADSWVLADANYLSDAYEFDSLIKTDDEYLLYGNGDVYAAESVATDNWTKVADNTGFRDLGAYYDEDTGNVHVYFEQGEAAGLSGKHIGHAVSSNGVDNWTVYPSVWTAPDGYGVGDFAIVEQNETIYLFGDYDPYHPKYNVSVWASKSPYAGFRQVDKSIVGMDDPAVGYGVGDPSIVRHNGSCVMAANMYPSASGDPSVHIYTASCSRQ